MSSGGPATTASNDQLVSWSRPLVATIEAMNLVPAPASLGTPTVDPTAGTISYPYDFSAGAALGSVSDPLGISTDLTFRFGGTGSLVYASGLLFATARLDTYPLVSETLAVGSLTAGDLVGSGIVYPGGIMKAAPTTQGPTVPQKIPGDTGTTSTIPPTAGSSGSGTGVSSTPADSTSTSTLPPDTTPATTVPVATMPIETLPISSVPVSSVPVDSVPAAPTTSTVPVITTLPNQPSSVTETLQSASLGYAIELLTNGDAVLVPTYTFTASDGSLWRIVALDPADFRAAPVRS